MRQELENLNDFPSAALAFAERELRLVRSAAERKDHTALGPLMVRVNNFIEFWGGAVPSQDSVFEKFPDCGHLLADLGRELAIECDGSLAVVERERLHLEFQTRLAKCRECAERIQKGTWKAP